MTPEQLPNETAIWRYMRFWQFVSMLQTGSLWFTRPCKFADKWEGLFPPSYLKNSIEYARTEHNSNELIGILQEMFVERRNLHRYGHFVNCWHISTDESDAMWRLYGLTDDGVAIQSTIGDVRQCLSPQNVGAVAYYDPQDSGNIFHAQKPENFSDLLLKRKPFSYEREFRIWFDDDDLLQRIQENEIINEATLSPGRLAQISDLERLIAKVVVAPADESNLYLELVQGVCKAYKKTWLAKRVQRSHMDRTHQSFLGI